MPEAYSLVPFSQAVQNTSGGLDGLVRELECPLHQLLCPPGVAPAVEPRDRLSLANPVSYLYEYLHSGARVYLIALSLAPGA